jgi:hypothetical protein
MRTLDERQKAKGESRAAYSLALRLLGSYS